MQQIRFARASMKTPTSAERRTINLDFIIDGSTQINKMVFKLTSRHREYLPNIPEEELEAWPYHQKIVDIAHETRGQCPVFIGKGLQHKYFKKGADNKSDIRYEQTGAVLIDFEGVLTLQLFIDDWQLTLDLMPSEIERFPFIGEHRLQTAVTKAIKGVWK